MSSEILNAGPFGMIQIAQVPHILGSFQGIHSVCANTPCDLARHEVSSALTSQEKALLVQNCNNPSGIRVYMTKGPDSLIFHGNDGKIFSALRAQSMYLPPGSAIPPYDVISQVAVPGKGAPNPIHLSMENEVCPVNTISRLSPFNHIVSQFQCLKKLDDKPRVIFSSDDFGSLSGILHQGTEAKLLKDAFLGLHEHFVQNSESGILNRNLKLVPEISDCLMLKNKEGDISLQRCLDGIVGTRERKKDNGKTVIFLVKSDDFHNDAPSNNGVVQVFKMDYKKKKDKGPKRRISFICHPNDIHTLSPDLQEQGFVHGNMTVQDILNQLEHTFRHEEMSNIGCDKFHQYIQLIKECRERFGEQ